MRRLALLLLWLPNLAAQTIDHAKLARDLNQSLLSLRAKADAVGVEALSQEALAEAEKAGDPLLLANCLHNRALILRELRHYPEAESLHRRALAVAGALDPDPRRLAMLIHSLAALLIVEGRPGEAEPLLRRALALPLRQDHPLAYTLVLNATGQMEYALGRDVKAEASFKRAIAAHATVRQTSAFAVAEFSHTLNPAENSERLLALILNNQGSVAYRLRQIRQAEQCWRRSILLYRQATNDLSAAVAAPMANLGELLRLRKQYSQAAEILTEALPIFEKAQGPDSYRAALVLNMLGNVHSDTGDLAEARRLYERSLRIVRKSAGEEHSQCGIIIANLAHIEFRLGATDHALEMYARSLEIIEKALGHEHPMLVPTLSGQAAVFRKLGRVKEAKRAEAWLTSIQALSQTSGIISVEDLQQKR